MKYRIVAIVLSFGLIGCVESEQQVKTLTMKHKDSSSILAVGQWVTDANKQVMNDPQTSGLTVWDNKLVSLSDGSASPTYRNQLHIINPESARLVKSKETLSLSSRVRRSCFSGYLTNQPDYEAIVADSIDNDIFYLVTEDATRTGSLSQRCQRKYGETGSTDYPTLLLRIRRSELGATVITHVRPLQFTSDMRVGNFPNGGIEGAAITPNRTLYLGLERDKVGKPRIFSLKLTTAFWDSNDFAKVTEPKLRFPFLQEGAHPINGLAWMPSENSTHPGFLFAAARNDNEIWILDLAGKRPAIKKTFIFAAPTNDKNHCTDYEIMDNTSIEGIAIFNKTLWMINDPWKRKYHKNIQCQNNKSKFEAMAPLLFSTPIEANWLNDTSMISSERQNSS